MTLSVLALIGVTIVFSSFLSGVFGMAGGMVLLGVLLVYFDVATGMILFSIIQFFANGWRVVQWRRYVLWPIFYWYVARRASIAFAIMWMIAFVPDKAMVYLLLGLMPFAIEVLPAADAAEYRMARRAVRHRLAHHHHPDSVRRRRARFSISSSRRACSTARPPTPPRRSAQTFSHVVRARLFRLARRRGRPAASGSWCPAVVLAIGGTSLAPYVIERMTDHGFRQWTRAIIFAISVVYLVRAGWLFWHG